MPGCTTRLPTVEAHQQQLETMYTYREREIYIYIYREREIQLVLCITEAQGQLSVASHTKSITHEPQASPLLAFTISSSALMGMHAAYLERHKMRANNSTTQDAAPVI